MSITSEQVAFLKTGFLKKAGGAKQNLDIVNNILNKYALEFIENAQKNLIKKNAISTGELSSSLTFIVKEANNNYTISIGYLKEDKAAKYYDFINKGVNGVENNRSSPYSFKTKFPGRAMMTNILVWLRSAKNKSRNEDQKKGLSKLQGKRKNLSKIVDKTKDLKSAAFAISTAIKKKGIKPTFFFDDAITKTFGDNFIKTVGKALAADVSLQIVQYGNNN